MVMEGDSFNLSLADFSSSAGEAFKKLLFDTSLADVTLVCDDDKQITAHKVILGSFSQFFQNISLSDEFGIIHNFVNHSQSCLDSKPLQGIVYSQAVKFSYMLYSF